jgi:hypothetical protein
MNALPFMQTCFGAACSRARLFFASPVAPLPFGCLRIGLSVCLLAKAWTESGSLMTLFGNQGIVQWSTSELVLDTWSPRISWLADPLASLGIDTQGSVLLIFFVHVISLFGLLVGWQSRIMAVQAWFTYLLLSNSSILTNYGVDSFAKIALFYCVVMPVGASVSLDRLTRRVSGEPTTSACFFLRILQLHVCLVYLSAGLAKAQGEQWWNGEAVWRALNEPQFRAFDLTWLADVPWVMMLACWGTLLVETGYCVAIWPTRVRPWWLLAIIGMHLAIAVFMHLWLFSAVLIVLNVSAFGSEWIERALASFGKRTKNNTQDSPNSTAGADVHAIAATRSTITPTTAIADPSAPFP